MFTFEADHQGFIINSQKQYAKMASNISDERRNHFQLGKAPQRQTSRSRRIQGE